MSKDLEIIKKIEKELGIELERVDKERFGSKTRSYYTDANNNIIGLDLYSLKISDISALKDLQNLTRLDLRYNQISDISVLKDLQNLTDLSLGYNQISDISSLKDLQSLTHLALHSNQISDISALKDLQNLTELSLGFNQISYISYLKDLQNLTQLYLWQNQITDISALKDLRKLTRLCLDDNQIIDISALKDLRKLTYLSLRKNRLTTLPKWITKLGLELKWEYTSEEKGIYLERNPLESPPIEIVKEGTEAVRAYFKSLRGERQALNEVKVLLVGDGGAGKTSLVKQLLGEEFDKEEPQTHGIKIKHWEVEDGQKNIKVRLWDFGGQEIMHATHQFFLSKRSLYVLVLDGRKEEKPEYWLKHIESFGGDSPILVVRNKIDEHHSSNINERFLQDKYKGIKGFYHISCQTEKGIDSFSKGLKKELANVELIHTLLAKSWLNVKDRLGNMNEDFINRKEYTNLCTEEGVKDQTSQDTLVDYLNDLGVILHFKELELDDTHVLDPKWATEGVYRIINSEKLADDNGLLRLKDLNEILARSEEWEYEFPRERHPFIISLMKKFELCYSIGNETILIPDLLEVSEPEIDFNYDTALRFVIEYDFLPLSVMPRFIVKMHSDIKGNLRWRTGCVLEDESFESTAVIKADNDAKKIYIYVNGVQKKDYFATVLYFFREINNSFEKLKVTELVPLPDDPEVTVEYEHLNTLASMGENEFIPQGSKKKYSASDLLGIIQLKKDSVKETIFIREAPEPPNKESEPEMGVTAGIPGFLSVNISKFKKWLLWLSRKFFARKKAGKNAELES